MTIGLVGSKRGMTHVFTDTGEVVPVTVIEVTPNRITQLKTAKSDGYSAVQITAGYKKASRVTKQMAGHFAKAKVDAGTGCWEFRLPDDAGLATFELGGELKIDIFQVGQKVDVRAKSKGKGFAGTVKRHNFRTQDATHGNSLSHRVPGSIGQNQTPGRVFKGKKMAGRMGGKPVTVQSQEIIRIDADRRLLLIRGGIPGAPGGDVVITPSVKSANDTESK